MLMAVTLMEGGCSYLAFASSDPGTDVGFLADGSMATWAVDARNSSLSFIATGSPRFALQLEHNGAPVSLSWVRLEGPKPALVQFVGVDALRQVEVKRIWQSVGPFSFSHRVEVRNTGREALNDVQVILNLGEGLPNNAPRDRSLASYVYGVERGAWDDGDGWRDASVSDNSTATRFALIARHRILLVVAEELAWESKSPGWYVAFNLGVVQPAETKSIEQVFSALPAQGDILGNANSTELMFTSLWMPLRVLCLWVEMAIVSLAEITSNIGIAVVLFAVLVRLATLPITVWSILAQGRFNELQARIKPQIAEIKSAYRGAEQSERILSVYRDHGYSPVSGLKGSLGLFVQLPILIAVFNVTTESSIFSSAALFWINDLSRSDEWVALGVSIPTLGGWLNLLPIVLGAMNLLAMRRQRTNSAGNSLLVAGALSVLIVFFFYSLAAALVLYWMTTSFVQIGENAIAAKLDRRRTAQIKPDEGRHACDRLEKPGSTGTRRYF